MQHAPHAAPAAPRAAAAGRHAGRLDALLRPQMRCAIVASSTMNALAISAVVSPPTARSVSAIAEAGVSAGWQHMNSTVSVSSSSGDVAAPAAPAAQTSRLPVLAGLLAPPLVDQPPLGGLDQPAARAGRDAVTRPVQRRREQRLLDRVLGGVEVADTCGRARRGPAARARAAGPRRRTGSVSVTPPRAHHLPHVDRLLRARRRQAPARPSILPAISIARSSDSTSTIM